MTPRHDNFPEPFLVPPAGSCGGQECRNTPKQGSEPVISANYRHAGFLAHSAPAKWTSGQPPSSFWNNYAAIRPRSQIVADRNGCSGDGCAIGYTRHEHLLQHVALDRLLQNRNAAKSWVDAVDIVTGYENERHAAHPQNFGDGINQSVTEIDVEYGRV